MAKTMYFTFYLTVKFQAAGEPYWHDCLTFFLSIKTVIRNQRTKTFWGSVDLKVTIYSSNALFVYRAPTQEFDTFRASLQSKQGVNKIIPIG